ncbi:Transcriptional regulator CRZ1 [Pseudocercospora fuligena]|uniref:Transcriptional regulator CRZ1 n=1 Tax=Pseudocercospora fuligena TaxID=685502 RepID=A0A8H6RFI6_9PEZI|nr:Transcriptional regulator CRZ1 [Pseudocercospora fuligena]
MASFGSNSTNGFAGDAYNNLQYSHSTFDFGNTQQAHYGHRASAPDTLELSKLHELTHDVGQIPPERLIKPLQHQPWNGQPQVQRFIPSTWPGQMVQMGRATMTEPAPNQDQDTLMRRSYSHKDSETADSGLNKKELERDFGANVSLSLDQNAVRRPVPPQSVVSDHIHGPRASRKSHTINCLECGRVAKNASDARKHAFTHERPYRCEERGCSRKEGFATLNDRERHRKSVHNLRPTVGNSIGYICAACTQNGSKENKFWPRRDNFKAHIRRKHKDEWDESHLLEVSKAHRPDDATSTYGDQSQFLSQSRNPSQLDRGEGISYQTQGSNDSPPTTSLHTSQRDDAIFGSVVDSAVQMQDDPFVGMGSHANDMNAIQDRFATPFMSSKPAMRPQPLGQAPHIQHNVSPFLHPLSAQTANKRRRLSSTSTRSNFSGNDQHNHAPYPTPSPTITAPVQSQMLPNISPSPTGHKCEVCGKVKNRECDLKKHMKRHTRPYGCTFPNCAKKFGSRNDWKRHESGQHFLEEMWKCGRARKHDGGTCLRRPWFTKDQMIRHLKGPEHKMSNEHEIEQECDKYHLGREGHVHFWCGFCKILITQPEYTTNAWENRFKHIGDHFDHDKWNIDDWVCVEENKAKKLITPQDEKESRRRARNGYRAEIEDEDELEEWTPDMGNSGSFASNGSFGDLKTSPSERMMKISEQDDPDADGESDIEMYTS